MNAPEGSVRSTSRGAVVTVLIDRPARHNSLVPPLLRDLADAFDRIVAADGARVAVLRAAGASFSTGGDLRGFGDHGGDLAAYAAELVGCLNEAIAAIIECDVPVIAAVDGQVTGGSLGLVLACDLVAVTPRASFTPWYTQVGFSPDGGWTALLPQIIGPSRARAVQLLNDTIDARQALDLGLAHRLAEAGGLDAALEELCARIVAGRAASIDATRRLLRGVDYRQLLEREREAFVRKITDREAGEGIDAFLARRT